MALVLVALPITPPTDYAIFFKASTFALPVELNSMRTGGLQEFRFWNTALDLQTIREWMNIKVNRSHPKSFLLTSHIPMDRKAIGFVFDVAYLVNPTALYKQIDEITYSSLTLENTNYAPVGDNGSGSTQKITAVGVYDDKPRTGLLMDFRGTFPAPLPPPAAPFVPDGDVIFSRVYDEPINFPAAPLIYSKIYWVVRNYGSEVNFNGLYEIIFDIKEDQFMSGLFPILNTPSDPDPLAATFKLFKRPSNSTNPLAWTLMGDASGFGSTRFRRPGSDVNEFGKTTPQPFINSFSQFFIGVAPNILPVRLVSFSGRKLDAYINLLEWKTAFEFNNEAFEIEKSYNAKDFFKIGKVVGKNHTETTSTYEFQDKYGSESAYYRLSQKDRDGKRNYSKTIYIPSENEKFDAFSIYPNPVGVEIYLKFPQVEGETFKLQIFDMLGVFVFEAIGDKDSLQKSLQDKIHLFQRGLYVAQISNGFKLFTTKFVKN
jgi:hypothetical protein